MQSGPELFPGLSCLMLESTSDREISSFNMLAEAAAWNSVSSMEPISAAFLQYNRALKYSCQSECLTQMYIPINTSFTK